MRMNNTFQDRSYTVYVVKKKCLLTINQFLLKKRGWFCNMNNFQIQLWSHKMRMLNMIGLFLIQYGLVPQITQSGSKVRALNVVLQTLNL